MSEEPRCDGGHVRVGAISNQAQLSDVLVVDGEASDIARDGPLLCRTELIEVEGTASEESGSCRGS